MNPVSLKRPMADLPLEEFTLDEPQKKKQKPSDDTNTLTDLFKDKTSITPKRSRETEFLQERQPKRQKVNTPVNELTNLFKGLEIRSFEPRKSAADIDHSIHFLLYKKPRKHPAPPEFFQKIVDSLLILHKNNYTHHGITKLLQNNGLIGLVLETNNIQLISQTFKLLHALDPLDVPLNIFSAIFCKPNIFEHESLYIFKRFALQPDLLGEPEYLDFAACCSSEGLQLNMEHRPFAYPIAKEILRNTIKLQPCNSFRSRIFLCCLLLEENPIKNCQEAYEQLIPIAKNPSLITVSNEAKTLNLLFKFLLARDVFPASLYEKDIKKKDVDTYKEYIEPIATELLFSIHKTKSSPEIPRAEFIAQFENIREKETVFKLFEGTIFYRIAKNILESLSERKLNR